MRQSRGDRGFTLVELLVVAALLIVLVATVGTFFLAGTTPAVAAAAQDVGNAFNEGRETAIAMSEATIVFTPVGTGYSARVYRGMPGSAQYAPVNGPTYDSSVTISETAGPLGAPSFAFRIDGRGSVTGYKGFNPSTQVGTVVDCPASGHFVLALAYDRDTRTIPVPCVLSLSMLTPAVQLTPPPGATPNPATPGPCPTPQGCAASLPPFTATCPPGYTPDGSQPNVCDSPTPTPSPTPPPTMTPTPTSSMSPSASPTPPATSSPSGTPSPPSPTAQTSIYVSSTYNCYLDQTGTYCFTNVTSSVTWASLGWSTPPLNSVLINNLLNYDPVANFSTSTGTAFIAISGYPLTVTGAPAEPPADEVPSFFAFVVSQNNLMCCSVNYVPVGAYNGMNVYQVTTPGPGMYTVLGLMGVGQFSSTDTNGGWFLGAASGGGNGIVMFEAWDASVWP